jgi:2'-5' RNA ligase
MGRVALALCLLFDSRTDRLVRQLWQRLENQGVPTLLTHTHGRHHPHLSLAVLREWDLDRVRSALQPLPDAGPCDVAVQGTVVFPRGRGALACSASANLAARQERVVDVLRASGAEMHRHYEHGRWVPHVSVATSASSSTLAVVVNTVSDVLPVTLVANQAALIDTSTGQQWLLPKAP